MSLKLDGVALITGAASGIGRAAAKRFAEAGCKHLVLVDKDEAGLAETVKECQVEKSRITAEVLDILDDKAVEALVASIPDKHGSLNYALNIAGIGGKVAPLHEQSMSDIDTMLNINLRAQILLNQAEAKVMLAALRPSDSSPPQAVIINYASILGMKAGFGTGAPGYVIAKAGLIGLTKYMAAAYASRGIKTNAIAPGFIDTPMLDSTTTDAQAAYLKKVIPEKRLGQPEELSDLALFLCSAGASYINGATINVDGGFLA